MKNTDNLEETTFTFLGTHIKYDESWTKFLDAINVREKLESIEKDLEPAKKTLIPNTNDKIFRFLKFDLTKLKVVILGQDPYVDEDAATGRAFEVGNHAEWIHKVNKRRSYHNLLKCLTGKTKLKEIKYNEHIKFPTPKCMFDSWQNQRVLMLNMALTVEGASGKHLHIWEPFMQLVVDHIASHSPKSTWFLWGNKAKESVREETVIRYEACHPAAIGNEFLNHNHFKKYNEENPYDEIDWWGHNNPTVIV